MNIVNKLVFLILAFFFCTNLIAQGIIITSDSQLLAIADNPDAVIDVSTTNTRELTSLRKIVENNTSNQVSIFFDEFYHQYRNHAGIERTLTPDNDEYVTAIKRISDFTAQYGKGFQLSLLSPLEIGSAFKRKYGDTGRWLMFKTGFRDPVTGYFSVDIWQQQVWTNNKGRFTITLKDVRAYAFKSTHLGNSGNICVYPDDIKEVTNIITTRGEIVDLAAKASRINSVEKMSMPACRLNISYKGKNQLKGYDRVFVVLEYETPEMDYFSPKVPVFLKEMIDKYKKAEVNLTGLYSDEMHIQQDWNYSSHMEDGQFNQLFYTKNLQNEYNLKFNANIDERYLLYFMYGPPYYEGNVKSSRNIQYVMGNSAEDVYRTMLLRDRYYKLLNDKVVDVFKDAKLYAEQIFNRKLATRAYTTWAESPTIDFVNTEKLPRKAYLYEYTPNFIASNTVHQAASACYNYFKWGEYLSEIGVDFAESGWADRNYYGSAMAASLGVVNSSGLAYADVWGLPPEAVKWKYRINRAFGSSDYTPTRRITGSVHRDIEVLIVYPMNLVAAEPRFGSWMTQYGYANYLTSEKITELGHITKDGKLRIGEKEYGTLVILFEPLVSERFLSLIEQFSKEGGKVVWCSMPPLISQEGNNISKHWGNLFGIRYDYSVYRGEIAAGKRILFSGILDGIEPQYILTDFLVDRIYPVTVVAPTVTVIANESYRVLGTQKTQGKGVLYYLGFRPRDDQSASLGYESRTFFEILEKIGAYPPSYLFKENDNPTVVSRREPFLVTSFPNGAISVVKHYKSQPENWDGEWARDTVKDSLALANNPMPNQWLSIDKCAISGARISYQGLLNMTYRLNDNRELIAFEGYKCSGIKINKLNYRFSSDTQEMIYFAPINEDLSNYDVIIKGKGTISIPIPTSFSKATVIQGERTISNKIKKGKLQLDCASFINGEHLTIKFIRENG